MSDESGSNPREERRILAVLEALESGALSTEEDGCAYLEAVAMLPYGLDEVPPPAAVQQALLSEVERRTASAPRRIAVTRDAPPPQRAGWMLRVAAVVAVALLGVSAFQFVELGEQRRQLERQETRITELGQELATLRRRAEQAPAWLASSGTELCPLERREAAAADAKGWLFVRQDHQHWYVAFEGLEPAPAGHVYEVWFLVDGRLVSGGRFAPDADGRATLGSPTMPTHVAGVAVTLEPDNGDDVPSEEMVLYGDEVMLTL